ncbi:hypothetical protein ACFVU2_19775 [Leifsonia sp. NPDC058194]|uniref:hypothetical protein n=1 Tax=Leifsonia sp. NPDC058194 TaxID=3346374 RepID=UPI0036D79BF7
MATTEVQLTYAGRRLTTRGTLAYFYLDPNEGKLRGFKKPLATGLKVGTIIRVHDEDGYYTSGPLGPVAVGHSSDAAQLLQWSAEQEADVALHAQAADSKRIVAAGNDPMREALEPIRRQLAAMSSARRSAAIGWIITYLQTGQRR